MKKILSVVMVVAMLLALSATALAAGQKSPSPGNNATPPVVEKPMTGEGKTTDGKAITVKEWKPEDTGFADAEEAVEDAVNSDVFEELGLDPADFTGSSLASVSISGASEPVTLVVFYGEDGKPAAALYFDGADWFKAEIEPADGQDGVFTVTFEKTEDGKGFDGEVKVEFTDK